MFTMNHMLHYFEKRPPVSYQIKMDFPGADIGKLVGGRGDIWERGRNGARGAPNFPPPLET